MRASTTNRAMSLIEVILAMAVFMAFFLAILEAWPLSARAVQQAKSVLVATEIGQQQMELALYQATGSFTTDYSVPSTPVSVTSIHNGMTQTMRYTYTVSAPGGSTSPKDITVRVQWSEPGARGGTVQRSLLFETLLASPN